MQEQFVFIPIEMLDYSGRNPRQEVGGLQELADNIREYGVLEPIVVRPKADRFEIVVGERRVRAGMIAGLKEIPSIVRNLSDLQTDEIRLIENVQRQDLTDAEKGDAIYFLLENYSGKYASMKSIAEALKVSPNTIVGWCSKSRKLSRYIQELVAQNELTERAAQLLLKYDHSTQDKLANAIVGFNIRGGRDGAERRFIQLYDQNPSANLRELAEDAKGIQTVQVPLQQLSPKAQAEVHRILEERKERAKTSREKALALAREHSRISKALEESENTSPAPNASIEQTVSIPREIIRKKAEAIINRLDEIQQPFQRSRMIRIVPEAMDDLVNRVEKAPERRQMVEKKLDRLRELEEEGVVVTTLWDFGERENYAGSRDFYGNCPPQVVEQCLLRLTKAGDLVVDPMAGSGTAIDVCSLLGRRSIAYDLNPHGARNDIIQNDSRKIPLEDDSVDMVFLHPPYWDMVYYSKADDGLPDLSRASTLEEYLDMLKSVLAECRRILKPGKFLCVLLGDRIKDGRFVPLSRKAAELAERAGLIDYGYAVKFTQGSNSLRTRGKIVYAEVAYTENLKIEHDLVMFFRKDDSWKK